MATSREAPMIVWAALSGLIVAGGLAACVLASAPAQAGEVEAPYCIQQNNSNGPTTTAGSCRFFDYQQCLEAAAGSRGTCVANIDYRGGAAPARGYRGRMRY